MTLWHIRLHFYEEKKQPTGTECVSKAACMYVFVIHLFFRFMCPMIAIEVAADFVYIETHNTCLLCIIINDAFTQFVYYIL